MTKTSIDELEAALAAGDEIEIQPNGKVKRKRGRRSEKVLTVGQPLGSNY
jgi:hypothetical protein